MLKIDISILKTLPSLDKTVIMQIEPLAPLSMVCELPGSYYKNSKNTYKKNAMRTYRKSYWVAHRFI